MVVKKKLQRRTRKKSGGVLHKTKSSWKFFNNFIEKNPKPKNEEIYKLVLTRSASNEPIFTENEQGKLRWQEGEGGGGDEEEETIKIWGSWPEELAFSIGDELKRVKWEKIISWKPKKLVVKSVKWGNNHPGGKGLVTRVVNVSKWQHGKKGVKGGSKKNRHRRRKKSRRRRKKSRRRRKKSRRRR